MQAAALPRRVGRGRVRRGRRRARPPPRGRQPGLPPRRDRGARRRRHRQPVRLQGRRHHVQRQGLRLLQQPHAVRRLRPGQPLRPRRDGAVLLQHHRLRRRLDHRRAAGRDGAQVRRAPRLRDRAGRRDAAVRPQGQPPAVASAAPTSSSSATATRRSSRSATATATSPRAARRCSCRPTRRRSSRSASSRRPTPSRPDRARGHFYPTFAMGRDADGNLTMPASAFGRRARPAGLAAASTPATSASTTAPAPRSTSSTRPKATQLMKANGQPFRMDLRPGDTVDPARRPRQRDLRRPRALEQDPDQPHARQAGRPRPASSLALLGLLGSLFVRPRRLWVRARRQDDGTTLVEVARARPLLRRRPGGRRAPSSLRSWQHCRGAARRPRGTSVTDAQWETLSNQGVAAAGVVYFLALLAYAVAVGRAARRAGPAGGRRRRRCTGRRRRRRARTVRPHRDGRPPRRPADRHRRARPLRRARSGAAWPRTPTGCRGATCTSSRSAAPSSSSLLFLGHHPPLAAVVARPDRRRLRALRAAGRRARGSTSPSRR